MGCVVIVRARTPENETSAMRRRFADIAVFMPRPGNSTTSLHASQREIMSELTPRSMPSTTRDTRLDSCHHSRLDTPQRPRERATHLPTSILHALARPGQAVFSLRQRAAYPKGHRKPGPVYWRRGPRVDPLELFAAAIETPGRRTSAPARWHHPLSGRLPWRRLPSGGSCSRRAGVDP